MEVKAEMKEAVERFPFWNAEEMIKQIASPLFREFQSPVVQLPMGSFSILLFSRKLNNVSHNVEIFGHLVFAVSFFGTFLIAQGPRRNRALPRRTIRRKDS
jgi:hypothetical protein